MRPEIRVDVPRFWDQGYLIIRSVFSPVEIEEFRRHAFENRQRKGDLLSNPHLRHVLLDDRILSIAAQILGETPAYYGDSDCGFGLRGVGFHKDNADRVDGNAPDWKGMYTQIRFGIYLQDHAWHSGGLRLIPGSHHSLSNPGGKRVNVRTRLGDLVVWNLRTDHAAGATMLRFLPWVYVETRWKELWESRYLATVVRPFRARIPLVLFANSGPERAALFFSLGREDAHMERYVSYLKMRAYAIEAWKNSEYGPDVWEAVRGKNIKVIDVGAEIRRRLAAGDTSLGVNADYAPIPY